MRYIYIILLTWIYEYCYFDVGVWPISFNIFCAGNRSDNKPKLTRGSCKPLGAHAWAFNFLHAGFLAYFVTLKMMATYSSETSIDFQWTTVRYTPEGRTFPWVC